MTDIWCFTCNHELIRKLNGSYEHEDAGEAGDCACTDNDLACEPR